MVADFPVLRAVRIQLRVITAVLLREIVTRYGRGNLGFIWLFLEPMLFTMFVALLWVTTGLSHASNLPIVAFAITGYSSVLLWRNCATRCSMSIPQNMPLFYHRQVRVLDILLARTVLEIAGAFCSFVVLSCIAISAGWAGLPEDVLEVLFAWLLLAWYGTALAIIIGALTTYSEIAERFWHPTSYILFPLSGAVFMVEWLPPDMQEWVLIIPVVHGVELLREGYFGSVVHAHYSVEYLAGWCLGMTLIGLAMVRDAERRMEIVA